MKLNKTTALKWGKAMAKTFFWGGMGIFCLGKSVDAAAPVAFSEANKLEEALEKLEEANNASSTEEA